MNIVDIIILTLVTLSALVGFWRGLTREVLGISSWVLAIVLTFFLKDLPKPIVQAFISSPLFSDVVSALVVFVGLLIMLTAITYKFSDAIKASVIGGADRVLGLFYGVVRGFLIVGVISFGLGKFILKNPETAPAVLRKSHIVKVSGDLVMQMLSTIPPSAVKNVKQSIEFWTNNGASLTEEDEVDENDTNA